MKTDSEMLLNKAIQLRKKRRKTEKEFLTDEERNLQIKRWTTFYRRNLDIYIEERLRIPLKPFQRIMLHLMGVSQVFFAICSRGMSKTFTVALYGVAMCMLYPYSEVVITASTQEQAAKMVRDKIEREIIKKISPVLCYFYDNDMIKVNVGKDAVGVMFFNGSTIKVLTAMDSSRGERATILVYEEARLLKKYAITSIFEPMMRPRQAEYFKKLEYATDTRLQEEGISIYITSARRKSEWFWKTFKDTVIQCYTSPNVIYNFFAGDIFNALKYGLKTWKDWEKIQKTNNELDVAMEYLNEMIGEIEDAYFTMELFNQNQKLNKAFRPPNSREFNEGTDLGNAKKKGSEIRALVIDFAFTNTTKKHEEADNTVIECVSGFYKKGKITCNLDYLETLGGGDSGETIKRIHELFWDYQADYIVLDIRSGGEVMYNDLTKPFYHKNRNSTKWNPNGFTVCNEMDLQIVGANKIEDLRKRTVDKDAIPCIIPVVGSMDLNSVMWQSLHSAMRDGFMRFLIDDIEYKQFMETKKEFIRMSPYERMEVMLPFVQTSFLIIEGINLKPEWRDGRLRLKEPRRGTKDRIVALSYVNYFFRLLENKLSRNEQSDEFDVSDWENLVIE